MNFDYKSCDLNRNFHHILHYILVRHLKNSLGCFVVMEYISAPGIRAVCFKSPTQRPMTDVRPQPAPTTRSDGLLKQSAWGIRAVCFKGPFRRPFTDVRPRPAPMALSDGLLKQSASGIRAVCFKSPFRRPVTDVRHGPLSRTSETNGAPYGRTLNIDILMAYISRWAIGGRWLQSPASQDDDDGKPDFWEGHFWQCYGA